MVDYHIHTRHSIDASGTISEYCDQAVNLGLEEICFTNHCELDPERDDSFIRFNGEREPFSKDGLVRLQAEINEARDRYKKKDLTVRFGIEVGYYKGIEPRLKEIFAGIDLDFVIGAIHCLDHICIDSSRECPRYFEHHDAQELIVNYFNAVAGLITSGMFDSIAHLDVYKKYGLDHYGNRIYDIPEDIICPIFEMIRDNHIALEINTAGMRFMNEFYPAPPLVEMAYKKGVKLLSIGSDSHRVEDLGKDLRRAIEHVKSYGYRAVHTFDKRNPRPREI
jgi:histidinol-phosphatase (PHP family)